VINCFNNPSGDSDLGDISTYHTGIIDQVVEVDEALMETYLETGEVSPEQLHAPFRESPARRSSRADRIHQRPRQHRREGN
jgi:elongation factor G